MDTQTIAVLVVAAVILIGAVFVMRYVEGPADGEDKAKDRKPKS